LRVFGGGFGGYLKVFLEVLGGYSERMLGGNITNKNLYKNLKKILISFLQFLIKSLICPMLCPAPIGPCARQCSFLVASSRELFFLFCFVCLLYIVVFDCVFIVVMLLVFYVCVLFCVTVLFVF